MSNDLPAILEHAAALADVLENSESISNVTIRSRTLGNGIYANIAIQLGTGSRSLGYMLSLARRLELTGVDEKRPYWLMPHRHIIRGDYYGTTVEVMG